MRHYKWLKKNESVTDEDLANEVIEFRKAIEEPKLGLRPRALVEKDEAKRKAWGKLVEVANDMLEKPLGVETALAALNRAVWAVKCELGDGSDIVEEFEKVRARIVRYFNGEIHRTVLSNGDIIEVKYIKKA